MATSYVKAFVDWLERYQKLSDAEFGRFVRAALAYKKDGTIVDLSGREELLFDGVRLDIDRDNEQYDAVCQGRREAGRKGAEVRWQNSKSHLVNGKNSKSHLPYGKNSKEEEEEKEEDYEKEEDINSVGAEQAPPPSFLLADGTEYILTENQITMLVNEFPMLDCFSVLADIRRWCAANPKQRKTRAGAARFVNAWFVRERDKKEKWKAEAEAKKQPEKKRNGKYDEIYDKY